MEIVMSFQERDRAQDVGDARLKMSGQKRAREPGAGPRQAVWSAVAGLAIVVVLFVVFYGLSGQQSAPTNQPAVMASPAPAAGVPAPAPEATTGQGTRTPEADPGAPAQQKPAGEDAR
jgi:hypothetical protein